MTMEELMVDVSHMVSAEWTKLRSVRSNLWVLAAIVAVVIGLAVVVAETRSLQPDDTVLGGSLTAGGTLALLLAGALGASHMASEHGTGLIAMTFAACPQRRRVLFAKATVIAAALGATGLLAAVGGTLVGRWLLDGAAYAPGDPVPAVFGIAATVALTGIAGLAVGAVVRHPAGAAGTVMGVVLLPILLGPLAGDLQPWVAGASPSGVLQKLAQSSDAVPETVGTLGAWPSLAVLTGCVCAGVVVAALIVERRDA